MTKHSKDLARIAKAIRIRSNYLKETGYDDATVMNTRMVALWLESPAGQEIIKSLDVNSQ